MRTPRTSNRTTGPCTIRTRTLRTRTLRFCTLRPCTLRTVLPVVCMMLFAATAFAAPLAGVVTDRTTGKPSAGDMIAVINTAQSMDEIAKTTSDAAGRFQMNAPDGGQILLHVTHRGADYFKSVAPGSSSVSIDVYDSAAKVDGIGGEALVLRAETDPSGKALSIAENFFVQNASAPPRTEFGGNTFDFYLPKGAAISQTLASAPGGLPTNAEVKAIDAASGHYAFLFPVRPGETRFQVVYSLPYSGKQAFSLKLSVPTGDVAVMLPKTMQFQGTTPFQPLNQDPNAQTYDAHEPPFAQPVQFSLAGAGQLPQTADASQGSGDQSSSGGQTAASGTRPGGGLAPPDDPNGTNDPWAQYKWWILGLLGVALVVGAGAMLKSGQPNAALAAAGAVPSQSMEVAAADAAQTGGFAAGRAVEGSATVTNVGPGGLLHALRDELFELETDRLAGRLNAAQYAEQKAAFDVVLRRAMGRIDS